MVADEMPSLEEYLDDCIAKGCSLEQLEAEVLRLAAMSDADRETCADAELVVTDEQGREAIPVETPSSSRTYWNIRDAAEGDPTQARQLIEWALRKRRAALNAIDVAVTHADQQILQVGKWRDAIRKREEAKAEHWEAMLFQAFLDFYPGERKAEFIAGALCMTKQRTTIQWDEDAALTFAEGREDVDVLAPRKISRSSIKSLLDKSGTAYVLSETGETVEFVRDVEPDEPYKFEVKQG